MTGKAVRPKMLLVLLIVLMSYWGAVLAQSSPTQNSSGENLSKGDPARGKALFTGVIRFTANGPPCMACHSVVGIGALGGGAMGPDLTWAYGKYSEGGLKNILKNPPFKTMNAIFSQKYPLTPQERADLIAFLESTMTAQRTFDAVANLALIAFAGAIVLFAVSNFSWKRRLTGVRKSLVQSHVERSQ